MSIKSQRIPWWRLVSSLVLLGCICWSGPGTASAAEKDKKEENEPPPEPEDIKLDAEDGLEIALKYYPGTEGAESVPIIVIHDWTEKATDYEEFALRLQSNGHAVAVPDLRGHGDSKTVTLSNGSVQTLEHERLRQQDLQKIVMFDLQAVKQFLIQENNKQRLNIKKLCLVGIGRGTLFAMNFTVWDWHWPELVGYQNGRDVTALVLISPQLSASGLKADLAINHPVVRNRRLFSMLLVVGQNDKRSLSYSNKIYGRLQRSHALAPGEPATKTSLIYKRKNTTLQGFNLLTEPELETEDNISAFIQLRLVDKRNEWEARELP